MTIYDEETRRAGELLDDLKHHSPEVYVWRGFEAVWRGGTYESVDLDAPVGGDEVRSGYDSMKNRSQVYDLDTDDVRYVEIPGTAWGDYCGSDYNRSNARSLRRDFAEHVITVTGDYSSEFLVVRLDSQIPTDLYDAIVGICDYPLYDEGDHSELESELEAEDWDSWGRDDFRREIGKHAETADKNDTVPELDSADAVDEVFYALGQDGDLLAYRAETAVGGYWEDFERAAERAWQQIRDKRRADWDAYARHLSNPIPGQMALLADREVTLA